MKTRTMLVLRTDGTQEEQTFTSREPPLRDLQKLVGGYIEMVPHSFKLKGKPAILFVNEDGLRLQLPRNEQATVLCEGFHTIVGTAVLVER